MSEERVVKHGLIRHGNGEYQLCAASAEIPGKQLVWVLESIAKKQGRVLNDYHDFQDYLARRWESIGAPNQEIP